MEKNFDFVVVGYAGVDHIIRIASPAQAGVTSLVTNADNRKLYFGGNGSNISCCLGRLGCSVYPLMRVGGDHRALGYLAMLQEAGVCTDGVAVVEQEVTSICHLVEDDDKNHLTMTYPGAMNVAYAVHPFDDTVFAHAHMGVLSVCTYADVIQFLQKCRLHHLPFAFCMRADYESFPQPVLRDILHEASIIFTNEVERGLIEQMFGLADITQLFKDGVAKSIVTTMGAQGCAVYEKTRQGVQKTLVPAVKGGAVVDATGAGDAFASGFLYGYLKGQSPAVCAGYGCAMSSFIIEQVGCLTNVPTEAQMLHRAAGNAR